MVDLSPVVSRYRSLVRAIGAQDLPESAFNEARKCLASRVARPDDHDEQRRTGEDDSHNVEEDDDEKKNPAMTTFADTRLPALWTPSVKART